VNTDGAMDNGVNSPTLEVEATNLDAVIHTRVGTGASGRRVLRLACSPAAGSIVLFVAIIALRIAADSSQNAGILLLLIAPVVVLSLSYTPLVGAAGASVAIAVFLLSQQVLGDGADLISVGTRAFTYYAIPLTIWLARQEAGLRSADAPVEAPVSDPEVAAEQPSQLLTPREREVLGLVAAGHTSVEIADMLVLSVRTIESHRASMRRKLGRPAPSELVRLAQRFGLLADTGSTRPTDGVAVAGDGVRALVYPITSVQ
jgi:DNA-binding CsgD family transcriptional regulator